MSPSRRAPRSQPVFVGAFDLRSYQAPRGYVRVSTDEQAEEGTSIEVQIQQIQTYASAYGFNLNEKDIYVDEGWSGKDLERPAMKQLRADARAGKVDCILVTKLDRLSRNLRDTVNLCLGEWQDEAPANQQVVLKSISEPFDTHTDFGRMVFGLLAMFAEFERRRIADRTWSGKANRAESGRNAGHRAPYGFRLAPAADGKGSLFHVVEEEAATIVRMAEMYMRGYGFDQIAHRLNEEGVRFRNGHHWQSQNIRRVLTNPLIAGTYVYGRTTVTGGGSAETLPESQWVMSKSNAIPEPIIAPELFESLKRLRESRRTGGRREASSYLLSGLVRCGRCGSACGVKLSGQHGEYQYYRCLARKHSGASVCDQNTIRADKLEAQVLQAIRTVLWESREALVDKIRASLDRRRYGLTQSLKELTKEELQLLDTRGNYFRWLEAGQLRPDSVQERLDAIEARLQELSTKSETIRAELSSLVDQELSSQAYEHVLRSFVDAWDALAPQERKRMMSIIVSKIVVDGYSVTIHWTHDLHEIEFVGQLQKGTTRGAPFKNQPANNLNDSAS